MKNILVSVFVCSAIMLSGAWYPASAAETKEPINAQKLFENKCSLCHSINRSKLKKKKRGGWERTVMRMKNRNGCPLTDEEATMIIDYLAKEYGK